MNEEKKEVNMQFLSLVMSLSTITLQQLGKIANPLNGKIERNLESAKATIDMLIMLRDKTKGNLAAEEERFLNNTLADLQLNYADELKKGTTETSEKRPAETAEKATADNTGKGKEEKNR